MELKEIGKKKFLGKGNSAKCYILETGNVFKKFNTALNLSEIDRFKYFMDYKNDSIYFPIDFVYDNKKFHGYIMEKALGTTLREKFSSSNLLTLSTHSLHLESSIKYISSGGIMMYDFHDENILYDDKKLSVIDPDDYSLNYVYTSEQIKDKNISAYRTMIGNLFIENIDKIKSNNFILDKVTNYKYMNITVSEMIYAIKSDMDKYYKENIETVDDIRKISR